MLDYGQVDSYSEENKEVLASRVNSREHSFVGISRVETGPGLGFEQRETEDSCSRRVPV